MLFGRTKVAIFYDFTKLPGIKIWVSGEFDAKIL